MENVIDKIQTLLADEESLKQIQGLYDMLSNGSLSGKNNTAPDKSECESENTEPECEESDNCNDETDNANEDPFSFGDNMGFDFSTLFKLQGLFGNAACSDDKNVALLTALKPHLSQEKQYKVDKALKMMHLFEIFSVLKESGLLKDIDKML